LPEAIDAYKQVISKAVLSELPTDIEHINKNQLHHLLTWQTVSDKEKLEDRCKIKHALRERGE
jgi:hypothetical protein